MRYSILIHESPEDFEARTDPAQQAELWDGVGRYLRALHEAGVFVGGAGLQPPATATRLLLRDGRRVIQDGPYPDTKEQLGGLFLIEVPNLDVALEWAGRFPQRPGQVVEVRPTLPGD
ncbi:YciI family protein [Solimonas flava]|uniref:YciI family protein n=1 Tax=Solimonas flava TaxID=415849 RepID=UPI000408A5FD|nr:YciI family protein [Solimonas flava]